MKKVVLLSLGLFISLFLYCQDRISPALAFTEVVQVDSILSSKELYQRARSWFAESYRSAQDVIQMDDKENGKIIGKGSIKYNSNVFIASEGTRGWIRYTISIQVKDGRYRYEITDFYHEGNPLNPGGQFSFGLITTDTECPYQMNSRTPKGWKNKVWSDIKETIQKNIIPLKESMKATMGKPAKNSDSDW